MKMTKMGILLRDLGASELAYTVLNSANLFVGETVNNVSVFYEDLTPPVTQVQFGVFDLADAYSFDGPIVATCLSTAYKLVRMPGPSRFGRFFYPWNLEWLSNRVHYNQLFAYRHPRLNVIARSASYKKILENNFNIKCVGVVESCQRSLVENLNKLMNP